MRRSSDSATRPMEVAVRLILYIGDNAPACESGRRVVERAVQRFDARRVELSVRNLSRVFEFERTARDRRVLVVPMLMMLAPREDYLLRKLTVDRVVEFIRSTGLEPQEVQP